MPDTLYLIPSKIDKTGPYCDFRCDVCHRMSGKEIVRIWTFAELLGIVRIFVRRYVRH